ncbi:hypothetical protein RND71_012114 [Anisodus tanguticus]|uniref:Uncharacterized protein n=1 Tax=Anisodus tanguticus TaxID=243964 RepID=A0AAE1SES9_9SOLA|nr:hypothetical protein RND71_012114 [Anisodus tanguticus]
MSQKDNTDRTMLGQIVSGVIDGSFDAGYFLLSSFNVSTGQVLPNNRHANTDQMLKIQSQFIPLLENLRMVEQDEVMEVFEVENQSQGPDLNAEQGKEETSHEREQASDLSDKLVLGSQCAAQPEDADTEKSDYAANLETQTYNSHP